MRAFSPQRPQTMRSWAPGAYAHTILGWIARRLTGSNQNKGFPCLSLPECDWPNKVTKLGHQNDPTSQKKLSMSMNSKVSSKWGLAKSSSAELGDASRRVRRTAAPSRCCPRGRRGGWGSAPRSGAGWGGHGGGRIATPSKWNWDPGIRFVVPFSLFWED